MTWLTNKFDVHRKTCVISGGSQGVGAEIAKRLVKDNADVVIVARTAAKLDATVAQLQRFRQRDDQVIRSIAADISEYAECERVFRDIVPDVVFCCAGSAKPGLFTDLTPQDLHDGIRLNYNTALFFTHAAFQKMAKPPVADKKHIVLFSSVVAFFPFIGYAQYSPLKAAVRSLAETLRQEGLPYNIHTSCVFPGNFDSEGYAEENLTKPEITRTIEGPSQPISCEECSDIVVAALQRGTSFITTDFVGYFLSAMSLGNAPRNWWPVQVVFGLVLSLLMPVFGLVMNLQIMSYFRSRAGNGAGKRD